MFLLFFAFIFFGNNLFAAADKPVDVRAWKPSMVIGSYDKFGLFKEEGGTWQLVEDRLSNSNLRTMVLAFVSGLDEARRDKMLDLFAKNFGNDPKKMGISGIFVDERAWERAMERLYIAYIQSFTDDEIDNVFKDEEHPSTCLVRVSWGSVPSKWSGAEITVCLSQGHCCLFGRTYLHDITKGAIYSTDLEDKSLLLRFLMQKKS